MNSLYFFTVSKKYKTLTMHLIGKRVLTNYCYRYPMEKIVFKNGEPIPTCSWFCWNKLNIFMKKNLVGSFLNLFVSVYTSAGETN